MEVLWTKNLKTEIYKDALAIRKTVFMGEQNVPKQIELDGRDYEAIHFVGYENTDPVTTGRIIEQDPGIYTLQRVATLSQYRGVGYGSMLLKSIENYIEISKGTKLVLDAQDTAIQFYKDNNYTIEGEGYIKAGIPHHSMSKTLDK